MEPEIKKNKNTDHLDLIFNFNELAELITESTDVETFLQKAVNLVSDHLNVPVCSIYLFDDAAGMLVLKATHGLNPGAVNHISMAPGQGLVGHSFKEKKMMCEGNAGQNARFKYFIEAGEDPFNSFLCVPIQQRFKTIGVMVIQHQSMNYFTRNDQAAIKTVIIQLANAMDNASLLMAISQGRTNFSDTEPLKLLKGKCASPGIAFGCAELIQNKRKQILTDSSAIEKHYSKKDFINAIEKTTRELKHLQTDFAQKLPESASLIFTSHVMILKDKNFSGKMLELIDAGTDPYEAVRRVANKYIAIFSSSPAPHLREKSLDVEDLATRLLENFDTNGNKDIFRKGSISVAREIYPSDVLNLFYLNTQGIILASGGFTSHVAILARSLKIPLIITSDERLLEIPDNIPLLMDAEQGNIYIDPDPETTTLFNTQKEVDIQSTRAKVSKTTVTTDGTHVTLLANINLLNEVQTAKRLNAQGVGLYRTEFPFLIRSTFPSEEEQYVIYKKLFQDFGDSGPVTIRTLDAGGEKNLAYADTLNEQNPELGLRSIRFSLKYQTVFEDQIKAILRAAYHHPDVKIMFPLISSLDDFLTAKSVVSQCKEVLKQEDQNFNDHIDIGMMIELPSVLETIDDFAQEADFFSIGTNDFIQYMLAADRSNKLVASYYNPVHPSVTRAIKKIVTASLKHQIDVSVCGEMAHDPRYLPFLIGVGIRCLSIDPNRLADVQKTIRSFDTDHCRKLTDTLLSQSTIRRSESVLDKWLQKNMMIHT